MGRIKIGDGTKTVSNLKFVDEDTWLPLAGGTLTGTLKGPMFEDDGSLYLASMTLGPGFLSIISEYGSLKYHPDEGIFAKYRGTDISITEGTTGFGEVSLAFGNGATYTITNDEIKHVQLTGGDDSIIWTFTGISDSKGTDSTVAASLKCLNDNYLSLSGGTLTGALTATKFTGDASGLTSIPAGKLTGTISIDRLPNLSSKYLPKTGGTISGVYSESGKAGSVSLAPGFVEVFSEGTGTIKIYNKDSNDMVVDQSNLTPSGLAINGDSGSVVASFSKTGFYVNYGGGANHISVTSQNIAIGDMNHSSDLTITANGIDFPELTSHLTGVTADKGTSTTLAMSQKGVSDNYLALSGGTLTGQLTLSNTGIKFNTNAIKDVTYSTTDLVAGTSTLATNSIYIVYE